MNGRMENSIVNHSIYENYFVLVNQMKNENHIKSIEIMGFVYQVKTITDFLHRISLFTQTALFTHRTHRQRLYKAEKI